MGTIRCLARPTRPRPYRQHERDGLCGRIEPDHQQTRSVGMAYSASERDVNNHVGGCRIDHHAADFQPQWLRLRSMGPVARKSISGRRVLAVWRSRAQSTPQSLVRAVLPWRRWRRRWFEPSRPMRGCRSWPAGSTVPCGTSSGIARWSRPEGVQRLGQSGRRRSGTYLNITGIAAAGAKVGDKMSIVTPLAWSGALCPHHRQMGGGR